MAKEIKGKYFYRQRKLDLGSGIAFFLCFLFIIMATLQDHKRDWKETQRDFRKKMEQRVQAQRDGAAVDATQLQNLDEQIAAEEQKQAQRQDQIDALDDQLSDLGNRLEGSSLNLRNAKAELGSVQYEFELATHEERSSAEGLQRDFVAQKHKVADLDESNKLLLKEETTLRDERTAILAVLENLRDSRKKMFAERERLDVLLAKYVETPATAILNAPMMDFIEPTGRIQQVVLPYVRQDLNYTDVPVVDRCMTCHRAIERTGFENDEEPFRTHPRLDLYVGSQSPHPLETFGCTTCHGGRGRALSFSSVAHTPEDEHQEKEWKERYGWKELHYFDNPMRPMSQIQSSCLKCHKGVRHVPEAPVLNAGRDLFFRNGCFGCHETTGYANLPNIGPELDNIASKTDALWLFNWLLNPRALRPMTDMPEFFGQSNNTSAAHDQVEARALVTYLLSTENVKPLATPPVGNAIVGKELFDTVGCLGCHVIDGEKSTFGPTLQGIGKKSTVAWIYNWVRDPRQHSATTRMPNLRLTEPEAADIAAYLGTQKGEELAFDTFPEFDEVILDDALVEFLSARGPVADAKATIAAYSTQEKLTRLGKRLVGHYGCFGCHSMQEFANASRIGTSLSEEGSKPISRLDFGLLGHDIGESRAAFFDAKLHNPRVFDKDRERKPLERLRMPNFEFNDEEVEALTVFLLSLTAEEVMEPIRRKLNIDETLVEKGEWMVASKNCRGCHDIDGEGGEILALYEDNALGPPMLINEGSKVKTVWLNNFLNHPTILRPWLDVRMPSFDMSSEDQRVIIDYFGANARVKATTAPSIYDPDLITAETHQEGRRLFEMLQCKSCHPTGSETPNSTPDNWGPNLALAQKRLKPDWVIEWMKSPQDIIEGTRMPSYFFDYDEDEDEFIPLMPEANDWMYNVRDYLMTMDRKAGAP